ncbi:hypothetical protein BD324DRAFT_382206 [Kockovaella imperatae]|uniref:Uncharacterized protein n=1 Tax=Kockovaella imperatae TaxID=4999 RepID=A0A1Y1UHM8_9TREE|nr:hypothetical protein BD324DRAFT_382206 [Kockovaella imperatae]ORX37532.1 hypothetical protein BD324DRAFT_382206 [Kockovaella imperatae]
MRLHATHMRLQYGTQKNATLLPANGHPLILVVASWGRTVVATTQCWVQRIRNLPLERPKPVALELYLSCRASSSGLLTCLSWQSQVADYSRKTANEKSVMTYPLYVSSVSRMPRGKTKRSMTRYAKLGPRTAQLAYPYILRNLQALGQSPSDHPLSCQ